MIFSILYTLNLCELDNACVSIETFLSSINRHLFTIKLTFNHVRFCLKRDLFCVSYETLCSSVIEEPLNLSYRSMRFFMKPSAVTI